MARSLTAAILACLLCWQSGGFFARAFGEPSGCCCHHEGASVKCHCPACQHAREVSEGQPVLKSCGGSAQSVEVPPAQPALAVPVLAAAPPLLWATPAGPPSGRVIEPLEEVATPPPLA